MDAVFFLEIVHLMQNRKS